MPSFQVIDQAKWLNLAKTRACGLCGQPLDRQMAFVGGPVSHKSRFFTDLPMHRACAEYALQVCPYLAAPRFRYTERLPQVQGFKTQLSDQVSDERPERFFLGITRHFIIGQLQGEHVVRARPWDATWWWQEGRQLEGVKATDDR